MRCKHCGKNVSGQYLQVDGYAFHQSCFVCGKCSRPIAGNYQIHKRKYYHPNCYKEKVGLICASCGKILEGSYVQQDGKRYHSRCNQIICDICGSGITGEYTYDKEGKYHKACFLKHKSPRCHVCEQPIVGKYVTDEWGNRAHAKHNGKANPSCDYCGRIISFTTSNGGYNYSDGRVICGICKLTSVEDDYKIRLSQKRVRKLLAAQPAGFDSIPDDVPVQLVDKPTLKRQAGSILTHQGQGLTRSNLTSRNNEIIDSKHRISILYGMPSLEFEAVLAHELLHVWLTENHINLSKKEMEGFCNLASALVYLNDNSKLAQLLLKRMESSSDRIYGKGYRIMNKKLKKYGWKKLKRKISN